MTTALPPDQIDGVLEEVDGAPVIRFVRHFDHPVADVWAAITQPDQLAAVVAALRRRHRARARPRRALRDELA